MQNPTLANGRNLIAACAAISVFGLAFGITYPLLSLLLEARGISTTMIGINSAMMPIGILLFSPLIPRATKRFGARAVAITAAIATALFILTYKLFDTLEAWFLIRLLQGMSIATLFVLSESWIVGSAGKNNRGKIVAIYTIVLSGSFAVGPVMLGWIGIEGWTPFLISALIITIGIFPLTLVREEKAGDGQEEEKTLSFFQFAGMAPMLLAAVFVFSIFDASTLSLIPVYAIQNHHSVQIAANALTALILGNMLLQLPLGWLADRYPHRYILIACALVTAIGLALLPLAMQNIWMWPLLVVVGATGYGVYTIALTALGERFSGQELVSGASAFALVWGMGALLGSVSGGWSMNVFGPHGLPVYLAGVYSLLVIGLLARSFQLAKTAPE